MRRRWFADADGNFYRNCTLILGEQRHAMRRPWLYRRFWALNAEFYQAYRRGVIRQERLRWWRDRVVQQASFRDAYPDRPALWLLDEPEDEKS